VRLLRRREPTPAITSDDPDALLVSWARENPQAFVALYDRYFPAVYGYCLSQLGDRDAAEDAASQTFLKALAALPGYREAGRFRPWLFTIAHNAVLDVHRAKRPVDGLEAAAEVIDPTLGPEEEVIAVLDRDWLEAAIARLPENERQVLELRRAGLRGQEIAQVLGISHEAAKKRQSRAMDRIRDQFATTERREVLRGAS
jgi:RNA polymerase sigma-70 factor, ECF subfamily